MHIHWWIDCIQIQIVLCFWNWVTFIIFQAKLNVAPSKFYGERSHLIGCLWLCQPFKIFPRFIIFSPLTYLLLSFSALSEQNTPFSRMSPTSFLELREGIPYKIRIEMLKKGPKQQEVLTHQCQACHNFSLENRLHNNALHNWISIAE